MRRIDAMHCSILGLMGVVLVWGLLDTTCGATRDEAPVSPPEEITQWLMVDRAGLAGLFGLGGQGKTTLAAHLAQSLADSGPFERIVWRSLVNAPPFSTVLQGGLAFLGDEQVAGCTVPVRTRPGG
jgi:hypothetical protein